MRFRTQGIVQNGSICAKLQRNHLPNSSRDKEMRAELHEATDTSESAQVERNSKHHENDLSRSYPESVCAIPQTSFFCSDYRQ